MQIKIKQYYTQTKNNAKYLLTINTNLSYHISHQSIPYLRIHIFYPIKNSINHLKYFFIIIQLSHWCHFRKLFKDVAKHFKPLSIHKNAKNWLTKGEIVSNKDNCPIISSNPNKTYTLHTAGKLRIFWCKPHLNWMITSPDISLKKRSWGLLLKSR